MKIVTGLLVFFVLMAAPSFLTGCGKNAVVIQGDKGVAGKDGDNGVGCSIQVLASSIALPNGGASIVCANGATVISNGSQGAPGVNGAPGTPGTPGTQITPIKLCSQTPSYPSVFVEYAVCINNQLYAVYSANGGFLAFLPPGAYSSNGIGSSCNLNVGLNCSVTH